MIYLCYTLCLYLRNVLSYSYNSVKNGLIYTLLFYVYHSYIYGQFSEFLLVFLVIKAVTINSYKKIIFSQQLDKDNEFLTLATCLFKELDEICH